MSGRSVSADARVLGAHYTSGRRARLAVVLVFGVVMVVVYFWLGGRFLVPLVVCVGGGVGVALLPVLRVTSEGVRLPFRRLLPWSQVEAVEEPDRWHDYVWIRRRDGSTVDVPPLTAQHVPEMRRLAGQD